MRNSRKAVCPVQAETFKNIRAYSEGQPLCCDGYMDLDKLRAATEGEIEWPEYQE